MELTESMNSSIERIIRNAVKAAFKNPREFSYLLKSFFINKTAKKTRQKYEQQGIHIPPFLIASITNSCNLFCKGCYARANNICSEAKMMETNRWGEIFEEARSLGVSFILLAGGEPLLRKDVMEKAATVKEIIFPVFTNGTMIDDDYINLFDLNRNLLPVFSIEGNRELTDNRRGEGIFQNVVKAIQRVNQKGIFFGASITVTTQNISLVTSYSFVQKLYQSGCRIIFFVEYVPVVSATKELAPDQTEREALERQIKALKPSFKNIIFISFPGDEKEMGGCLAAGRGFFHINPAGNAEPCPFSPYSDTNLISISLLDALKSPLFRQLNESGILLKEHRGGCTLFENESEVKKYLEYNEKV